MNYQILADELSNDPLTRGYSGMTDQAAADDLNTAYRTETVETITGAQVFNATDDAEFGALTDAEKDRWLAVCAVAAIDVSSGVAKSIEADIFGPGTTTRSNLIALKTNDISRGQELGLGTVKPGHVEDARRL